MKCVKEKSFIKFVEITKLSEKVNFLQLQIFEY